MWKCNIIDVYVQWYEVGLEKFEVFEMEIGRISSVK